MRDSKHYGVTSLNGDETTSTTPVIRKFLNPAVYIESCAIDEMPPLKPSFDCGHFKVKKCVCMIEQEHCCPCHPDKPSTKTLCVKVSPLSSKSSVKTDSGYSGDTNLEIRDDLRLSLTSLTSGNNSSEETKRKVFQEWLAKKKKEELLKQSKEEKVQKERETDRSKKEEEERANFKKWLLKKKKEEEKKKLENQRKEEEERIKSACPKRDPEQKRMALRTWFRQKQREELVRKIKEKQGEVKAMEDRFNRLKDSAKAYEDWLKSSKYKPKPLPLNRGIDSLKASASVTYINPTPWVPNIEQQRNL